MGKIVFYSLFLLALFSCKNDKNQAQRLDDSKFQIATENWPPKTKPNDKTSDVLKDWPEFRLLTTGFDALYNVGNTEDLSLVLDDLIEKQKVLAETDYPEPFNKPQIKSRQKVFHTYILKTKGDLIYRIDTQESILQLITSYNLLLTQMNLITEDTLDLKMLLEEE